MPRCFTGLRPRPHSKGAAPRRRAWRPSTRCGPRFSPERPRGSSGSAACGDGRRGGAVYGLITKITAVPGQRGALAAILIGGTQSMPGCLSYVVAVDPADDNGLWITEVWD